MFPPSSLPMLISTPRATDHHHHETDLALPPLNFTRLNLKFAFATALRIVRRTNFPPFTPELAYIKVASNIGQV